MYCTHCGARGDERDSFCGSCGTALGSSSPAPTAPTWTTSGRDASLHNNAELSVGSNRRMTFAIIGGLVGAMLGYVFRPSVFLVGQLPFSAVITRGGNLSGMDQLLVPAAQASFNLLVAGIVVGAVVGVVIAMFVGGTAPSPRPLKSDTRQHLAPEDEAR